MSEISNTLPHSSADEKAGSFSALQKWAVGLMVVGLLLTLGALFRDADRVAFAYLWGFTFVWNLVLGCLFFVCLHHATHAVWSVVVRRVAEMYAAFMPILAITVIPVLLFAVLYRWFPVYAWADPEIVQGDHLLEGKVPYLNTPFFVIRGLFFVLVWTGFARFFVHRSLSQDHNPHDVAGTSRLRRWSVAFLPLFALTVTFASFDWLMSLDPHWFSTIYGVYVFSGMAVTGLAAITLTVIWLRATGRLGEDVVRGVHLYNLGALLFTFTCFWAYIAFSQFMLIWYSNIPEETIYYIHRMHHGWENVTVALAILRFILPFFLLLSRPSKSNPSRLFFVSLLVLIGQLLDLYWLIMPTLHAQAPRLGWQEFGPPILLLGLLMWFIAKFMATHKMLAIGDPLYEQSCTFHL